MGLSDAFPLNPPRSWFDPPADIQPGQRASLTTDGPDAGRYVAIVAPYNQCILSGGKRGDCWTAPKSPTNYAAAMQGHTVTAEGEIVDTANIGGGVNHAPPTAGLQQAVDHYACTASQTLRVAYHDVPGVGIVAAGAAWPGISDLDVAKIRASALSGDWRWREELRSYDMAGSQLVSTPGFPRMPKVAAIAASLSDPHPAFVGGWGGPPEEHSMAPEPTVTLTLTATETARLHSLLQNGATVVNQSFTAAPDGAGCACAGHAAAAPVGQVVSGDGLAEALEPDLAEQVAALTRRVEELEGEIMSQALGQIDAVAAALPLPPDLEDEERWKMPMVAAAFDESKHPRHKKGTEGGGRFAPKVGDRVVVNTDQGQEQGQVVSKSNTLPGEQERLTVKFDDGTQSSWNGAQVTRADVADASTNAQGVDGFEQWQSDNGEHITKQMGGDEVVVEPKKPGDLRDTVDAMKKGDWQTVNKNNADALANRGADTKAAGDFARKALEDKKRKSAGR